jgi:hypothetical protein
MRFIFLSVTIFFTFYFFGVEASSKNKCFKELLKNNVSWIKSCQEDKVYLKPERLEVSFKGINIIDEHLGKISIEELYANKEGLYTKLSSLKKKITTLCKVSWCYSCEYYTRKDDYGRCMICGFCPY